MARRALIIGIDKYDNVKSLSGCVNDANLIGDALARNDDASVNYDCRILTSPGSSITRGFLRTQWYQLFHSFDGDILFYFSGHGSLENEGGYLVTQDGTLDDPGLPMDALLTLANGSNARSVLMILDCCHSGALGNPGTLQNQSGSHAFLREGVTILAASRPAEVAIEIGGQGVFTDLVVGALRGGAADVRGQVSAAAVYGYVEAALGPWDQRPIYKSHAKQLDPVRKCTAKVSDDLIRELPTFFTKENSEFRLDMTFEETNGSAVPENVAIFKKLKAMQIGGLLTPKVGSDLFWTAERSGYVLLTPLGQFYHRLVTLDRI